jgi:hypothetical protein
MVHENLSHRSETSRLEPRQLDDSAALVSVIDDGLNSEAPGPAHGACVKKLELDDEPSSGQASSLAPITR